MIRKLLVEEEASVVLEGREMGREKFTPGVGLGAVAHPDCAAMVDMISSSVSGMGSRWGGGMMLFTVQVVVYEQAWSYRVTGWVGRHPFPSPCSYSSLPDPRHTFHCLALWIFSVCIPVR